MCPPRPRLPSGSVAKAVLAVIARESREFTRMERGGALRDPLDQTRPLHPSRSSDVDIEVRRFGKSPFTLVADFKSALPATAGRRLVRHRTNSTWRDCGTASEHFVSIISRFRKFGFVSNPFDFAQDKSSNFEFRIFPRDGRSMFGTADQSFGGFGVRLLYPFTDSMSGLNKKQNSRDRPNDPGCL